MLLPFLEDAFQAAADGKTSIAPERYVLEKNRIASGNLSTEFKRILKRAGVTPWPKLFMNLRSTRQTELENQFPTHVVCKWMGNSPQVAHKHYLKVTAEHFEQALRLTQELPPDSSGQTATTADNANGTIGEKNQCFAVRMNKNRASKITPETPISGRYWTTTPAENAGEMGQGGLSGAQCGANWSEIRALIARCEDLPEDVRVTLVAIGDAGVTSQSRVATDCRINVSSELP